MRMNGNIIKAVVWLEDGCCWDEGEFSVHVTEIVQGFIDEDDYDLIRECAWENIKPEKLEYSNEFAYMFTFIESGEVEDVGWLKYYILSDDPPIDCMHQKETRDETHVDEL